LWTLLLIRVRADFWPAKPNVVRKSAEEQIVTAINARDLKKPDLPRAKNFSMEPWALNRISLRIRICGRLFLFSLFNSRDKSS